MHLWLAARDNGFPGVCTGEDANILFGGSCWKGNAALGWDKTQTLGLFSLEHYAPYAHPDLISWAQCIVPKDKTADKKYIARVCQRLGFPKALSHRKASGWTGSWVVANRQRKMMSAYIVDCSYPHLKTKVHKYMDIKILYRVFSIAVWLDHWTQIYSL